MGSVVLGKGFIISIDLAKSLINKDPRNKEVLFPYLNGDDVNSEPNQEATRWIINFFDWPEEKAMTYPDCYEILKQLVKPERQRPNNKMGREKWWQYYRRGVDLYRAISKLDQVLVINRHSKHLLFTFEPTNLVFSDATIVFAHDDYSSFAVLTSGLHELWAWKNSSTMGASTLRYSAINAYETFPFPQLDISDLSEVGRRFYEKRRHILKTRNIGLTELQNSIHNADIQNDIEIIELRNLQIAIDLAVISKYEWNDLNPEHSFIELDYLPDNDKIRFGMTKKIRDEIFKRLIKLNHDRHRIVTK